MRGKQHENERNNQGRIPTRLIDVMIGKLDDWRGKTRWPGIDIGEHGARQLGMLQRIVREQFQVLHRLDEIGVDRVPEIRDLRCVLAQTIEDQRAVGGVLARQFQHHLEAIRAERVGRCCTWRHRAAKRCGEKNAGCAQVTEFPDYRSLFGRLRIGARRMRRFGQRPGVDLLP
ncbi:MAG: hypothetical protein PSV46_15850 [Reyranella sp.]|nr:hypothetical protein [Reyranella sp.]